MSKHQFDTEINQLLDLMIHSLYSNKEIFLRELISNASDAIDKLKFLTISDEKFKDLSLEPRIEIEADKDKKKLIVRDNGIGMNDEDMIEHLGTIAKSGTKSFLEHLSGDAKKDSSLIGQFGVGFYSAFMVAKKIEVISKKAGEDKAYKWISTGKGEYEIKEAKKERFGTEIILHMKKDDEEYLEDWTIERIVKKYSNHIPFPIFLLKEEEKDGKKEKKFEQINKASALWRLNKNEITDEEYIDFYKQLTGDSNDPLHWVHTNAEGTLEYSTLFYIPSVAPFDLFRVDYQPGVKLYVKRVFITDDDKELMPTYLRFARGIIDSEDLPLNVSREILQHNTILAKIKKSSVKKILSELKKIKEKDFDKYLKFWKLFGKVLKEGVYTDFENKETILDLLLFKSTKRENITFKDYKEAMKEDQKSIYYITGEDEKLLKNSPLIESFKDKDIEVLIMDDEVDALIMPMVNEYDKTPVKSVSTSDIDEEQKEEKKEEEKKPTEEVAKTLAKMKEALKGEVKDVKISSRLKESPACLVFDKNDPDFQMQEMLKQMGQDNLPKVKPILEINPEHEIVKKLSQTDSLPTINDIAHILYDQARLIEGMKIEDSSDFVKRINKLLAKSI